VSEELRNRFQNLVLAMLAGDLDDDGRSLLRDLLDDHPELEQELEESRLLREALEEGLDRAEPPEGFARAVRARLGEG
jgi:hypothetical protein